MKKIIITLSLLTFVLVYLSKSKDEKIVLDTNKKKSSLDITTNREVLKTILKKSTKQFTNQGWKQAVTTAPDDNLVNLSPNFDEKLLANQISSNIFSENDLEHLYQIVLTSKEYKTKFLAIEAIGEMEGIKRDKLLIELFQQSKDKLKKDILRHFRPTENNQAAKFIINNILLNVDEHKFHSDALDLLASNQVFFADNDIKLINKLPVHLKKILNTKISSVKSALLN